MKNFKTSYINLNTFNGDNTINRNIINEFDEAQKQCEQNNKYKIKFIIKTLANI